MLDKLILFVIHWIIIYFIIYCLIIYFISKLNRKDDNDNDKRLLDFIWKCKYDFFKHTRLISLVLIITAVILKLLF